MTIASMEAVTTTESLVVLVAQLLGAPVGGRTSSLTDAGARVYAPRDWPTFDGMYPALFVSGPRERKRSLGSSGAPEFDVTGTIRVAGRDSAKALPGDGSSGVLLASLGSLRRQIEVGLINNPALMILIEEIVDVRAETAFKASGADHLGELLLEIDVRFYQGPEAFYPITGAPLTTVSLTTQYPTLQGPNVGLLIDLTQ